MWSHAGARGLHIDHFHRHIEHVAGNLHNLGRQPLSHLYAALVNDDTAIALINGDDGCRLLNLHKVVSGAILHRDHAQAALAPAVLLVELLHGLPFFVIVGYFLQVLPDVFHVAVRQRLPERSDIPTVIKVLLAQLFRLHAEGESCIVNGVLNDVLSLDIAKSAHRCARGGVGAADIKLVFKVRNLVRVVGAKLDAVRHDKRAIVERPSIAVHFGLEAANDSFVIQDWPGPGQPQSGIGRNRRGACRS